MFYRRFYISLFLMAVIASLSALIGPLGFDLSWEMIASVRGPRLLVALCAGAATAVAGGLSQGLFRNTLASPSMIGTESGAAFAVALVTWFTRDHGGRAPVGLLLTWGVVGAAVATLMTIGLATSRESVQRSTVRILLGGFALNALLASGTSLVVSILMESGDGMTLYHWLLGSFSGKTWNDSAVGILGLTLGGWMAMGAANQIDVMSLGEDTASSLGINPRRLRITTMLTIAFLVSISISIGGALPFVGLVAPHLARLLTNPRLRTLLPMTAILGATVTVIADLIARTARAPIDMDVGILTSMIGAPYFLWLLWREERL